MITAITNDHAQGLVDEIKAMAAKEFTHHMQENPRSRYHVTIAQKKLFHNSENSENSNENDNENDNEDDISIFNNNPNERYWFGQNKKPIWYVLIFINVHLCVKYRYDVFIFVYFCLTHRTKIIMKIMIIIIKMAIAVAAVAVIVYLKSAVLSTLWMEIH